MTPEGKVKADIKKWLKERGAYQFWPVQTGYGSTTVDALVCLRGRFIALECKRPGIIVPSPRQRIVMDEIEKAGGFTRCVDSLERLLSELQNPAWAFDHA